MPETTSRGASSNANTPEFITSLKVCLSNFANFNGRASAAEYWWFFLFYVLVYSTAYIIEPYAGFAVALVLAAPMIAVSWRRMHDLGKGGGYFFINLIPIVGTILWFIMCSRESEPGVNRFGERPRRL